MSLALLTEAELEVAEAATWYEDQRAGLGDVFLDELRSALDRIAQAPQAFALLESYTGPYEVRRRQLNRFPYLIIYSCSAADVIVVAVSHVRREPLYWLGRLDPHE